MSTRRVPVNAVALLASRVFGALVSVVVVSVSAHRLDLDQFGLMASVMTAGFLANSLITFGTDTVVTRAVAAARVDAVATTLAAFKLQVMAAAGFALASIVAFAAGVDLAVLVQGVALIAMAGVTVAGAVLRGVQRMDRLLVAHTAGGLATLVAVFVGFSRYEAAWVPIAALAFGSVVTALASFAYVNPELRRDPDHRQGVVRLSSLRRETAPFAAMVILAAVGSQAGLLLVEFASDQTAGGYGVAVRVSEAARLIPAAAMGAFFPAMLSGLHRTDRYRRWMRWLGIYGVVATAAMVILAEPANRIVFDSQPDGASLIRILALGLLFTIGRLAISFELIAGGHERTVLISAVIAAVVTVAGGLLVVGRFGAQGVAWLQLAGLVAATALLAANRSKASRSTT